MELRRVEAFLIYKIMRWKGKNSFAVVLIGSLWAGCWALTTQGAVGAYLTQSGSRQTSGNGTSATQVMTSLGHGLPDGFERLLSGYITNIEAQLANPQLDGAVRKSFEVQLAQYRRKLDEHRTESSLWRQLAQARVSKDAEGTATTEARLADYLAVKLGDIEGKRYPTGMNLAAVMDRYDAHLGRRTPFRWGKQVVQIVLVVLLLVPAAVFVARRIRRGRADVPR